MKINPWALIAWATLGICIDVGLTRFGYGIMLPGLRRSLALDYAASGAINTVHLLGYLMGTLAGPALGRRLGMRRLAVLSHSALCLGALVCAATPMAPLAGPLVLGLGRWLMGWGGGGAVLSILVMTFSAVPPAWRAPVSMLAWGSTGVAIVAAGAILPPLVDNDWSWRGVFLVCAGITGLLAVCFPPRGVMAAAAAPTGAGFALRDAFGTRWIFLNAHYFLFGTAYVAFATFAGTRLVALQSTPGLVSASWEVYGLATAIGAAITAYAVGHVRWRKLALMGAACCGAVGALVSVGEGAGFALAGAGLVGLGLAATPALVAAYARGRCDDAQYASAFSIATAFLGAGQLIGPVLAGALADRFGTVAVPLFAGGIYTLGVLVAMVDEWAMARSA